MFNSDTCPRATTPGPPGAVERPWPFPQYIDYAWCVCTSPKPWVPRPRLAEDYISDITFHEDARGMVAMGLGRMVVSERHLISK
jgi:hypothetical protein